MGFLWVFLGLGFFFFEERKIPHLDTQQHLLQTAKEFKQTDHAELSLQKLLHNKQKKNNRPMPSHTGTFEGPSLSLNSTSKRIQVLWSKSALNVK